MYLVSAVPLSLLCGLPAIAFTLAGTVLTAVWLGIPVLMLVTMLWRGIARMERSWLRVTLGVTIPRPYLALPEKSAFRRWRAKVRDPATWRDMAYIVLRMPLSIIEFALVLVWWAYLGDDGLAAAVGARQAHPDPPA